jgi:hypothetical protein
MEGRLEASAEGLVRVEARVEESSCREKMCWVSHFRHEDWCGVMEEDGLMSGYSVCGPRHVAVVNSEEAQGRGQEEISRRLGSRILLLGPAGHRLGSSKIPLISSISSTRMVNRMMINRY